MVIIKLIKYFFILIKIKKFFFKKKIFLKKYFLKINTFLLCLNCHSNKNYINYPELFKAPIIKNQNKNYLINSIFSYKFFYRKSFYMNLISNYIKNINYLIYYF